MSNPGKIGRMPWTVKRELHPMLRDAVPGPEILTWLNAQPAAREVLTRLWAGASVTAQNLSDYRQSAEFAKWLSSQSSLEKSQEQSRFVLGLASEAGLDLMDAADALVVSRLLEDLESATGDDAVKLMSTLASFRKGGNTRALVDLRREELSLSIKRTELDREKFEKQTVAKFMEWARRPEAQEILGNGQTKAVQMDLLHDLMFGKNPNAC